MPRTGTDALAERIADRIRREGPIPSDRSVDPGRYDEPGGFFPRGGGAGGAGRDFVTSPEVGVLFGAWVARSLDGAWSELWRPARFVVVDAGAGRGRLASDVLRAEPQCARALRYVLVERWAAMRAAQRELLTLEPADRAFGPAEPIDGDAEAEEGQRPVAGVGPIVTALPELPALEIESGVVVANELLDNLPFRIVERAGDAWVEVRVGLGESGFLEVAVPAASEITASADEVAAGVAVPTGARLPVPTASAEWLAECGYVLRRGDLVVIDYAATAESLVTLPHAQWLRPYREHQRGGTPPAAP